MPLIQCFDPDDVSKAAPTALLHILIDTENHFSRSLLNINSSSARNGLIYFASSSTKVVFGHVTLLSLINKTSRLGALNVA